MSEVIRDTKSDFSLKHVSKAAHAVSSSLFPVAILHVPDCLLHVVSVNCVFEVVIGCLEGVPHDRVRGLLGREPDRILTLLKEHVQRWHSPGWKTRASGGWRNHLHVAVELRPLGVVDLSFVVHHSLKSVQFSLLVLDSGMQSTKIALRRLAMRDVGITVSSGLYRSVELIDVSVMALVHRAVDGLVNQIYDRQQELPVFID